MLTPQSSQKETLPVEKVYTSCTNLSCQNWLKPFNWQKKKTSPSLSEIG